MVDWRRCRFDLIDK